MLVVALMFIAFATGLYLGLLALAWCIGIDRPEPPRDEDRYFSDLK